MSSWVGIDFSGGPEDGRSVVVPNDASQIIEVPMYPAIFKIVDIHSVHGISINF